MLKNQERFRRQSLPWLRSWILEVEWDWEEYQGVNLSSYFIVSTIYVAAAKLYYSLYSLLLLCCVQTIFNQVQIVDFYANFVYIKWYLDIEKTPQQMIQLICVLALTRNDNYCDTAAHSSRLHWFCFSKASFQFSIDITFLGQKVFVSSGLHAIQNEELFKKLYRTLILRQIYWNHFYWTKLQFLDEILQISYFHRFHVDFKVTTTLNFPLKTKMWKIEELFKILERRLNIKLNRCYLNCAAHFRLKRILDLKWGENSIYLHQSSHLRTCIFVWVRKDKSENEIYENVSKLIEFSFQSVHWNWRATRVVPRLMMILYIW